MKKIVVVTIISLSIVVLVLFVLAFSKKTPSFIPFMQSPTPTPVLPPGRGFQVVNYHDIFKDDTIAQQMEAKLQRPVSTEIMGDYVIGHFGPDTATFATDVYQKNQKPEFILETLNGDTNNSYYSDFALQHQTSEEKVLYDPTQSSSGFEWRIFPNDGVAFLANPDVGFTGKIIYFAPTSYDNFLQSEGKVLNLSPKDSAGVDNQEKFEE